GLFLSDRVHAFPSFGILLAGRARFAELVARPIQIDIHQGAGKRRVLYRFAAELFRIHFLLLLALAVFLWARDERIHQVRTGILALSEIGFVKNPLAEGG